MKLSSALINLVILITVSILPATQATLITFDGSSNGNVSESTITESGYNFDLNKKALITGEACGLPTCADNIQLSSVSIPEPATIALFGLVLVLLGTRKNKAIKASHE